MLRRACFSAVSLLVLTAAATAHAEVAPAATAPAAVEDAEVSKVVVTAAPYAVSADNLTASVAIVDRTDLDLAPPSGLGDLLSGMPGVRSTAFGAGASRPVVRGLAGIGGHLVVGRQGAGVDLAHAIGQHLNARTGGPGLWRLGNRRGYQYHRRPHRQPRPGRRL